MGRTWRQPFFAFAVSTGLSALYEIRRRRRKRVLQLLDLLLCVLVIGLTRGQPIWIRTA